MSVTFPKTFLSGLQKAEEIHLIMLYMSINLLSLFDLFIYKKPNTLSIVYCNYLTKRCGLFKQIMNIILTSID